jgi:hypothetical protein
MAANSLRLYAALALTGSSTSSLGPAVVAMQTLYARTSRE